jgi:hypothetical protein
VKNYESYANVIPICYFFSEFDLFENGRTFLELSDKIKESL